VYNPTTGAFTRVGDMVTYHAAPTATLLSDGSVLITGGDFGDGDGPSSIAELYDPQTGVFTLTGRLITGREDHSATLLPDGTVLITGGHAGPCTVQRPEDGGFDNCRQSELYNPVAGTFSVTGDLMIGRDHHESTLLKDGTVLITGGAEYYPFGAGTRPPVYGILSSAELYAPGHENLLKEPGFEGYDPPSLGVPGWVSDDWRETPAFSETHQPRTGAKNGACWTPVYLDCGLSQTIIAPAAGTYVLTLFATTDRAGGWVGANVNGSDVVSTPVETRSFGDYVPYTMTFAANAGDLIQVWMYSPATPGYVVIDDVVLTQSTSSDPCLGCWDY
jgi:hypothetical protein